LRRPGVDAYRVPQLPGVVGVPVLAPAGVLAVVAQQDDPLGTPPRGLRQRRRAAGRPLVVEPSDLAADALDVLRGHQRALEGAPDLRQVLLPPVLIQGVQHVRPRTSPEGGVGDDYSAAFFLRPPRPDRFAVVCGEAGAAGDADDFSPSAVEGFSAVGPSSLRMRTSPFCSSSAAVWFVTLKRSLRLRGSPWMKLRSAWTCFMEIGRAHV